MNETQPQSIALHSVGLQEYHLTHVEVQIRRASQRRRFASSKRSRGSVGEEGARGIKELETREQAHLQKGCVRRCVCGALES